MSRASLAVDNAPLSTRSRFLDDCIRYHWAYGPEPIDRQKIESLFLPHFEPWQLGEVGKITSLKSLSLDPAWLPVWQETTSFTDRSRVDLGPLQSLGKLEQLVLPSGLLVQDFDFMQGLKNLESLQFDPGVVDQPLLTPKFCPRLRTVSMFRLPSTRMLRALSQIKTLEKVVLVDSAHHLATEGDLHKVRRLLARRVELEFVENVDLVPPAFHDHLIEVRRAVRGKHLGFGGEETWSLPPGQGHGDREVVPEYQRWKIEHDAANILEYMKQLQFFDLEIAIIQMEGSVITRLRDVAGNPQVIESKRSEERKTLWFTPADEKLEEWNESLAKQNGVELDNSFTALFYPIKIRETLRQIEKDWLDKTGRKLIEVRQARFKIVPVEDRFEFRLIGIATRK